MRMHAIPVLHVASSEAAERFDCEHLGFEQRSRYRPDEGRPDPCYLVVNRDGAWLHLSSFRDDSVAGAAVYLLVEDVWWRTSTRFLGSSEAGGWRRP